MTRRLPVPVGNFSQVYDLMFTYDEHSGAGNNRLDRSSIAGEPLEGTEFREYVEFTHEAKAEKDEVDFMIDQGMSYPRASRQDTINRFRPEIREF